MKEMQILQQFLKILEQLHIFLGRKFRDKIFNFIVKF
jgi:hypothetical protein